ncbi:MAG: hypothetical protein ACI92Z_001859, partial [Paracoccaceae bacterium]
MCRSSFYLFSGCVFGRGFGCDGSFGCFLFDA